MKKLLKSSDLSSGVFISKFTVSPKVEIYQKLISMIIDSLIIDHYSLGNSCLFFSQRVHPGMIQTVQKYVATNRKRKASLGGSGASKQQKTMTIEESFAANPKRVKQVDVDKSIAEFIVQGIHPLATIEQPAFVKLVTSK